MTTKIGADGAGVECYTVNELCVGCGCESNNRRCKDGFGPCSYTNNQGQTYTDEDCCNDGRRGCHKCGGSIVCFRASFIEELAGGGNKSNGSDDIIAYRDLSPRQRLMVAPIIDIAEKAENGIPLCEEDFERIADYEDEIEKAIQERLDKLPQ